MEAENRDPAEPSSARKRLKTSEFNTFRKDVMQDSTNSLAGQSEELGNGVRKLAFTPGKQVVAGAGKSIAPLCLDGAKLEIKKSGPNEAIKTYLRVRPPDSGREDDTIVQNMNEKSVAVKPPEGSLARKASENGNAFFFDQIFGPEVPQERFFDSTTKELVHSFFNGETALCFAYGVTNSGKTYTIQGSKEDPGILPRAVGLILDHIRAAKSRVPHPDPSAPRLDWNAEYGLHVSYCEIYNETIYDLLADAPVTADVGARRPGLKLKEDGYGRVYVQGIVEREVRTVEEARGLLERGQRNRKVAETVLNVDSSRSHSVFTLKLTQAFNRAGASSQAVAERIERCSRLSFVDLAGSERAKRTGNTDARLKEAKAINVSLSNLSRCIEALRYNQLHPDAPRVVPYRQSKLTHLFQDAFNGFGRTVMIMNMNPRREDYDETLCALKFTALAAQIVPGLGAPPRSARKPAGPSASLSARASGRKRRADEGAEDLELETDEVEEEELRAVVEDLRLKWTEALRENARLEAEVREECAEEMEKRLRDLESAYRRRMEEEAELGEVLMEKKLAVLRRQLEGAIRASQERIPTLPRGSFEADEEKAKLMEQVELLEAQLAAEREQRAAESAEERTRLEQARETWRREKVAHAAAHEEVTRALAAARGRAEEAVGAQAALQRRAAELEMKLQAAEREAAAERGAASRHAAEAQAAREELARARGEAGELEPLRATMAAAERRIEELRAELARRAEAASAAETGARGAGARASELERALAAAEARAEAAAGEAREAEARREAAAREAEAAAARAREEEKSKSQAARRYAQLSQELSDVRAANATLNGRVQELSRLAEEAAARAAAKEAEAERLKADALRRSRDAPAAGEAPAEVQKLQATIAKLSAEVRELRQASGNPGSARSVMSSGEGPLGGAPDAERERLRSRVAELERGAIQARLDNEAAARRERARQEEVEALRRERDAALSEAAAARGPLPSAEPSAPKARGRARRARAEAAAAAAASATESGDGKLASSAEFSSDPPTEESVSAHSFASEGRAGAAEAATPSKKGVGEALMGRARKLASKLMGKGASSSKAAQEEEEAACEEEGEAPLSAIPEGRSVHKGEAEEAEAARARKGKARKLFGRAGNERDEDSDAEESGEGAMGPKGGVKGVIERLKMTQATPVARRTRSHDRR
eukprot:tig00021348_g20569.t1